MINGDVKSYDFFLVSHDEMCQNWKLCITQPTSVI
jgi:hypothetical protein